jgi:YD repeat-containing protein
MECKITSTKRRRCAGFTIVEMLVAGSIGLLIISGVVVLQMYSSRSFAAQYNYVDLNNQSHMALDKMSQKIRQTGGLISFATNDVTFTNNMTGGTLRYTYNSDSRMLTEITSNKRTVILRGCDWLLFSMYQRNPISNSFNQVVATNPSACKLLQVEWSCSRNLAAKQTNETEVMESAKIVLRNNP